MWTRSEATSAKTTTQANGSRTAFFGLIPTTHRTPSGDALPQHIGHGDKKVRHRRCKKFEHARTSFCKNTNCTNNHAEKTLLQIESTVSQAFLRKQGVVFRQWYNGPQQRGAGVRDSDVGFLPLLLFRFLFLLNGNTIPIVLKYNSNKTQAKNKG